MRRRVLCPRPSRYPAMLCAKVDWQTWHEAKSIAAFEKKKVSEWLRSLVARAVREYRRNPAYRQFREAA